MKYLCHVPTEQYGFISVEIEGSSQDAVESYMELKRAYAGGTGLPSRDFCKFIDCFLSTGKPPEGGLEQWEVMDDLQKRVVNEVKKALKRITK